VLYGRDREVSDLLAPESAVTVVSGDSGVGKSSLLHETVRHFEGVAPAPIAVRHAPAALQAGLLEALGAAAVLVVQDDGAARRIGKLLLEGGRRLARAKGHEVGVAVSRIVMAAVRDRIGTEFADLLTEYWDQVRDAATDDLLSRIRQAADPDVIEAIIGLAADVAAAAQGRKLLLSLDNVDRLQAEDRARLMDLGLNMPAGIALLCAFTSVRGADEAVLDDYVRAGIAVYPLHGLQKWAVQLWLAEEDLPGHLAEQICRETNGYGFAVADAIRLLRSGGSLADASEDSRTAIVRAATKQALRGLDEVTRRAAFKLSVLAAPLPGSYICEYLAIEPAAWVATESLLIDNHIFLPGDPPWFHDQRRRLLRQQVPDSMVVPCLKAAAAQLSALSRAPDAPPDALIQYADVRDDLRNLGVADPELSAVAELDDDALAVLGALIELTDGNSRAVDGEKALLYARQAFGIHSDPADALEHVAAAGLAVTASDDSRTAVVVQFGSVEASLYANGRIGSRLGRMPIARIASAVFNGRLKDPLRSFESAWYGIGDPPLSELARRSVDMQIRPPGTQQVRPDRRKGPSLLINGQFGETPFYAIAAYANRQDRDGALAKLQGLRTEPVFGRPVELTSVVEQPSSPLPARRLVRAFERALGVSLGNIYNSFDVTIHGAQIPDTTAIEQRLTMLNLLAEISNDRERRVTGHSAQEYGLLRWIAPSQDADMTAVVAGGRAVTQLADVPLSAIQKFDRVALSRLAGLEPEQSIGYMQQRVGRRQLASVSDMQLAVNEVMRHHRKIVAYNQYQQRRQIPADLISLQTLIQQQLDERETIAKRIADYLSRPLPTGQDIYLLIDPRIHQPDMIPGAGQDSTLIEAEAQEQTPRVRIAIEQPIEMSEPRDYEHWREAQLTKWREIFNGPNIIFKTATTMSMFDAILTLLGHMGEEVLLVD
jgi:hypothetical protein